MDGSRTLKYLRATTGDTILSRWWHTITDGCAGAPLRRKQQPSLDTLIRSNCF
jgi:hypothetical protein